MSGYNKFIAFFDVLGYRSFINNNEIIRVIEKMDDLIAGLQFSTHISQENVKLLEYIIFSDSVVFYTHDFSSTSFYRLIHVSKIFIYAALVLGLPVRGSVSMGEFHVKENLFFGKALVEAYENGEDQNWSGAFINDRCLNYVAENYPQTLSKLENKGYLLKYDVPCKSGIKKDKFVINWANEDLTGQLCSPSHIMAMFLFHTSKRLIDDLNNNSDKDRLIKIDDFIEGRSEDEKQSIRNKINNTIAFCAFARDKGGGMMRIVYPSDSCS